ncbi:MAG: dicarboxylate/amino acid:cation symporter [Pseudomonadota bacterium]|nr:dicarboxylate/amino acid:cation symporter [Pseudomonadota bacterium]MEC8620863.1 dicarboxylate/amino acid:cation symporter [Pseudomonadota bacterium]
MNSRWFAPLIFTAAILGWLAAMALPDVVWLDQLTQLLRTAFFSALKMVIAPLIFFSLIAGVMQLRASSQMGRLGSVTIAYYLTTTGIAVLIGLIVVLFYHPWTAFPPLVEDPSVLGDVTAQSARLIDPGDGSTFSLLNNLLQRMLVNPFNALTEMNVLGILVGAILLGLAAAITLPTDSALPEIFDELAQVTYKLASWVLTTLPIGLFAITFQLAQKIDFSTLAALGQLAGVVFGATLFHGLVVLPAIAWLVSGKNPLQFLSAVSQPMVTALFTSSSAATLPLSMQTALDKLDVDQARSAFVLPLGATANMDGTALFEGIAAVFLAYMFSIDLGTTGVIAIFLVAMLSSVGAPGIPSGSMAGMQMVLLAVGIPLEAIGLLLLIERPLDTFRTAVNVEGDLVGCLVAKRFAS